MSSVLQRKVFKLNRAWQLIDECTVCESLSMMCADAATGLDIHDDGQIIPVRWEDWLKLPLRNEDEVIHTPRLSVRMPTVIIAVNYAGFPKRRPKFSLENVARTYGRRCAYTDRILAPHEWSKDHVLPLSRGGKDVPENVVLADKVVNGRKGNRLPHEAGLPTPRIRKLAGRAFDPSHPDHQLFIVD